MTKKRRIPIDLTACLVAAALLVGHAAMLGGVVVCVGADGHIGVERAFDGCCAPDVTHAAGIEAVRMQPADSCGTCVDLQLRVVSLKNRDAQSWCGVVAGGDRSTAAADGVRSDAPNTVRIDQHWRSLEPISTVVLLT